MTENKITVLPHLRVITSSQGKTVYSALAENSIFLRSDCGGRGICGKCKVNLEETTDTMNVVNACTTEILHDMVVDIPESSLLSSHILQKPPATPPKSFTDLPTPTSIGEQRFGIAVDLGTTTIALYLCDITTNTVIASLSIKNPQAIYGDDVMSRIASVNTENRN